MSTPRYASFLSHHEKEQRVLQDRRSIRDEGLSDAVSAGDATGQSARMRGFTPDKDAKRSAGCLQACSDTKLIDTLH